MEIIKDFKQVADLTKKGDDTDLHRRLAQLEREITDLTRENHKLRQTVHNLTEALKISKSLVFNDPYYWADDDPTPYCPSCWDANKLLVHVVTTKHLGTHNEKQRPTCKHIYEQVHVSQSSEMTPVRR